MNEFTLVKRNMTAKKLIRIFNDFTGSKAWAARQLNVGKPAFTAWFRALKSGKPLPPGRLNQLRDLAQRIEDTQGACIAEPTVRSVISKLRTRNHGVKRDE